MREGIAHDVLDGVALAPGIGVEIEVDGQGAAAQVRAEAGVSGVDVMW